MHIFLTGDIQVGKTTVIRSFLSRSGLGADGFMTYWEPDDGGGRSLYLSPYNRDLRAGERYLIARDGAGRLARAENMTGVFDIHGTEILNRSGKRDVIIMDELGYLESKAEIFRQAVRRRIDGDVPVLGVIRFAKTECWDDIRAHPNATVREVTAENRDAVLSWLLSKRERALL